MAAVLDFAAYIGERTKEFTGREWVLAEIDRWLADAEGPTFFIITGEPGVGKTALAARLTQIAEMHPDNKALTLSHIVHGMAQSTEFHQALKLAEAISDNQYKVKSLSHVVHAIQEKL